MKCYPYEKGGGGGKQVLAMLKGRGGGGHTKFWEIYQSTC